MVADLAEEWEVSEDGKVYRFYLKKAVFFHDGTEFNEEDVVATYRAILDPQIKSPYFQIWSEVEVTSPEAGIVEFYLPYPYGSFIYNCSQGIVSSSDAEISLVDIINGTGPYQYQFIEEIKKRTGKSIKFLEMKFLEIDYKNFVDSIKKIGKAIK